MCVKTDSKRQYIVYPSCLRGIVDIDPAATVLVFWMPKSDKDKGVPPWRKKKGKHSIKAWWKPESVPGQTGTESIFFRTDGEIRKNASGCIRLRNGFKDEFWHALAHALNRASNSTLPVGHPEQKKVWKRVCADCRKRGSPEPAHKYDYFYGDLATREMCDALGQQWGWIDNWGCMPEAIRSMKYGAAATQNQANLQEE